VSRTFATVSVCLDVCLVLMFYTDVMIVFKAQYGSIRYGLTENAGRENGGQSKLQGMKLQDMNMTDQKWRQGVKLREYRSSDRLQRRNAKSIQSIRPQMFVASEPVSYRTLLCPVVSCFMSCYFMSCIFMSCHLVRHFHVLQFHARHTGPSISCPSFSRPAFSAPPSLQSSEAHHVFPCEVYTRGWSRQPDVNTPPPPTANSEAGSSTDRRHACISTAGETTRSADDMNTPGAKYRH